MLFLVNLCGDDDVVGGLGEREMEVCHRIRLDGRSWEVWSLKVRFGLGTVGNLVHRVVVGEMDCLIVGNVVEECGQILEIVCFC